MFFQSEFQSPVGMITLACDSEGKNLLGLWIRGQKYHGESIPEVMTLNNNMPVFALTKSWLERYFSGGKPSAAELPLAPMGSGFRQCVWSMLGEIPYGKVITYGDIAKAIAKKMGRETMSSQAIGGAVGHNPISIIIPCHRVIGSNSSLTGYAAGIETKVKLLEFECVDMSARLSHHFT